MLFFKYGKEIKVNGRNVFVSIKGSGEKVLVLLPGLGSPSPIIEFKALSSKLEDSYTVITIDCLGYGMSDSPDTERTVENISEEIHNILKQLKYEKYILMAHSISGIYCLYYANKYPNEVEAFVGIDSSVPQQIEVKDLLEENLHDLRCEKNVYKIFNDIFESWKFLRMAETFRYNIKDRILFAILLLRHLNNNVAIDEILNANYNFNITKNMKFPPHMSVLFLLAEKSIEITPHWVNWHREILVGGKQKNKIIVLQGEHYLHISEAKRVVEEIKLFLNCNMD